MTILEDLASYAKKRVEQKKKDKSLEQIILEVKKLPKANFEFESALRKTDLAFICECKKASPSKGIISADFPYLQIASEFESAGADCISVLTEPSQFLGSDKYLYEIANSVSIPCLRKDFIVDEYMVYEARLLGASAVLLICSILNSNQLKRFIKICNDLGLSALVEVHDEVEVIKALNSGAKIIGVNNRNLKDFSIDMENSIKLRRLIPKDILYVSESGIKNSDDIKKLREIGIDAVLIGESLMKAINKKEKLDEFRRI